MKIVFKGLKILHLFLKFKMLWSDYYKSLECYLFELFKHCYWVFCNILRMKDHKFPQLMIRRSSFKNELNQGTIKYRAKTIIKPDSFSYVRLAYLRWLSEYKFYLLIFQMWLQVITLLSNSPINFIWFLQQLLYIMKLGEILHH
jgi:hypothetical protein